MLIRNEIAAKADLIKRVLMRKIAEYELLSAEIQEVCGDLSDAEIAELKAASNEK